jgi:hypothetical protein
MYLLWYLIQILIVDGGRCEWWVVWVVGGAGSGRCGRCGRCRQWAVLLPSSLWLIANGCGSFWLLVDRCDPLWLILARCGLWLVVGGCGSLRVLVTPVYNNFKWWLRACWKHVRHFWHNKKKSELL